jgi:hypothetical protein
MEVSGQLHAASHLPWTKFPLYPSNTGWVGPRADLVDLDDGNKKKFIDCPALIPVAIAIFLLWLTRLCAVKNKLTACSRVLFRI